MPANYLSGRGGGGRISLDCANLVLPDDVFFSAATGDGQGNEGQMGTLYVPNTATLPELFERCDNVRIVVGGLTSWGVDSLTITNRSIGIGENQFSFTVTNDLVVGTGGWFTVGGEAFIGGEAKGVTGVTASPVIDIDGSVLVRDGGMLTFGGQDEDGRAQIDIAGNLVVTNGGGLFVYSGPTNDLDATNGTVVSVVGNTEIVGSNSWIFPYCHRTNGGTVLFELDNLSVDAGSGFDAEKRGFAWLGSSYNVCYAPKYGASAGNRGAGSGYGGKGGDKTDNPAAGGLPYGYSNAPALPGAPGGRGFSYLNAEPGGGSIQIVAADVSLDGTLNADGGDGSNYGGGGGGGGIFVMCDSLSGSGTGLFTADGGNGGTAGVCGGGGGGRIAVGIGMPPGSRNSLLKGELISGLVIYYSHVGFDGFMSVDLGTGVGVGGEDGTAGTAHFMTAGKYTLTIEGSPGTYGHPAPDGYGTHTDKAQGATVTNAVVTPDDEADGLRHECLGWTLVSNVLADSGSSTQVVFQLNTNMTLTWYWTNEYELAMSSGAPSNGWVDPSFNGWYTNLAEVIGIGASPSGGYVFSQWLGDVPLGHETDNPLDVTMDQPRTIVGVFGSALGVNKIWDGVGSWQSATNWTPEGAPGINDHAYIGSGTVTVSQAVWANSVLVSNGATVAFTNWNASLNAEDVRVEGIVRPAAPFPDTGMSNRVYIVCSNFLVTTSGWVMADGLGFLGDGTNVYGPGVGINGGLRGSGGSYGGYGGSASTKPRSTGVTYGSAEAPYAVGSAGGYGYDPNPTPGSGGGAIVVVATNVTVNGTISADGGISGTYGGGGSGGGIVIQCQQFAGTGGVVRADGGECLSDTAGRGGGGRMAILCSNFVQPLGVTFSAQTADAAGYKGQMGTLYFPDASVLTTTLSQFDGVRLVIPGFSSWGPASLTMTNGMVALANDSAFSLRVTNDLLVANGAWLSVGGEAYGEGINRPISSGSTCALVRVGGNMTVDDGGIVTFGGQDQPGRTVCEISGDLVLTNGAKWLLYSGPTNAVADNGGIVRVAGDVTVAGTNSWICPYAHQSNGAAIFFDLAGLTIRETSGIDADAKGYAWLDTSCYAPSYGGSFTYRGAGSGHGGKGGDKVGAYPAPGGDIYDSTNAPVLPGAPGGYGHYTGFAEPGGGVVRIDASSVRVNGTITADGGDGSSYPDGLGYGGGGGGGSVFIICNQFQGNANGLLSANGGPGGPVANNGGCGGGGGGRISVAVGFTAAQIAQLLADQPVDGVVIDTNIYSYFGSTSVTGGPSTDVALPGGNGTVVFLKSTASAGTLILVR